MVSPAPVVREFLVLRFEVFFFFLVWVHMNVPDLTCSVLLVCPIGQPKYFSRIFLSSPQEGLVCVGCWLLQKRRLWGENFLFCVKATHPMQSRFIGTLVVHLTMQSPPALKQVLHILPLDFSCLSLELLWKNLLHEVSSC